MALRSGHGQAFHAPILEVSGCGRRRGDIDVDDAPEQIDHRWTGALVRDVKHLRPGKLLELLSPDVLKRARTGGGVGYLARLLLGVSDKFRKSCDRKILFGNDEERGLGNEPDRHEALDRIPSRLLKQPGIGNLVAGEGHEQRVTVRLSPGRVADADVAARTAFVIDDELPTKLLGHP